MTRYAIGLGSNLGDRLGNLRGAVTAFGEAGEIVATSGLYETDPVGGPEQGKFLNAVVVVDVGLDPMPMIHFCLDIEQAADRVREERWGPRTLDVDILAWEGEVVSDGGLEIPHPRAHQRLFVLRPLVEVWPDAILANNLTAAESLEIVEDHGVVLVDEDWSEA